MGQVAVSAVSKIYGEPGAIGSVVALDNVSFEIPDNRFCAILGHSGCGKTTLLNIAAGFEQTTKGVVTVDGTPIREPGWQHTMIFQDYALFPWMSVAQNIAFGLEMKNIPRPERARVTRHHVELVGLQGFEHKLPHHLSGGMRQRVAIARALAVGPRVLLMDEPFAALDAQTRDLMQVELLRIWREARKTVLFVTHQIDEAIYLSDRVMVMSKRPGRAKKSFIVELTRPREYEMRVTPEFNDLKLEIWNTLKDEIVV